MAISQVHLAADAFLVCTTHALSTEREEVMGLLIGEIDEKRVCHIGAVIVLRRSDKQADRVEISPEQLSDASTKAETLGQQLHRPMRVVGWYHSHPHITVWPSHVDVRTQAMYQLMDEGFVGLIFSVFNEDKNSKQNRMQVICFQSIDQSPNSPPPEYDRIEVPLHIVSSQGIGQPCLESLVELPKILSQEEDEAYEDTLQTTDLDLLAKIHNSSVYCKSQSHIMEVLMGPRIQTLENRLKNNNARILQLKEDKLKLLAELEAV